MPTTKRIGYFLGPIFFLLLEFLPLGLDELQSDVLAVAAWMLIWWILETVPIYITAMLPMVLFPFLGIMDVKDTFIPYANPIIFLFLGGFIIALAMEERRLHERLALSLIRLTGSKPRGIVLGFMISTAAVAMWISNTATAVMMLPIGLSIIEFMKEQQVEEKLLNRFSLLLMLGIAYSANIGGMMTLIGTPPNLVFAGYYFEYFHQDFGFDTWLVFGMPVGVLLLFAAYFLLTRFIYPLSSLKVEGVEEMLFNKWKALGRMKKDQMLVLVVFSLTVFLWVFANQINELLGERILNNTGIAMLGGILMFIVPVNWKKGEFILEWKSTSKLPWGILILFGGGLSLAAGLDRAGIIDVVASFVSNHVGESLLISMLGFTAISLFMTEVMSNVALVTVLLPVIFGISDQLELDPLILTLPVTLAASCAFMMPISTPPNAVVFSSGMVSVKQMMKAGIWMNIASILIIVMVIYFFFG